MTIKKLKPDVVAHICNPSMWEAEVGRSQIQGQLGLHREFEASLKTQVSSWKQHQASWDPEDRRTRLRWIQFAVHKAPPASTCVALEQPWAGCVLEKLKDIDIRTWCNFCMSHNATVLFLFFSPQLCKI